MALDSGLCTLHLIIIALLINPLASLVESVEENYYYEMQNTLIKLRERERERERENDRKREKEKCDEQQLGLWTLGSALCIS